MRTLLMVVARFLMLVMILEGQRVLAETPPALDLASTPPDPTEDIAWSGGTSGVAAIETAWNHARTMENEQLGTTLPMLTLPAQDGWDQMSSGQKALWLINRERTDRGVLPLSSLEPNITDVSQTYAQYLLDHQVWGHSEDGRTPPERIAANPTIGACQDSLRVSENLAYFASRSAVDLPLERAVYEWMYADGDCCGWFHRRTILWNAYHDNSGPQGQEGFLGIGHVTGPYLGYPYAHIIVMDVFDPCATWEYNTSSVPGTVAVLYLPYLMR
ncbi:MAG: CAP domain-containing protein [Chloroflexaceae bacterium]|nr:CAP domain-containing protein [Chloroflexaceae bacterium]